MSKIEGLSANGRCQLTTDFGEGKVSAKGTPFRAALARDGRGVSYRLFAFGEVLVRASLFGKGDAVAIFGEMLSVRDGLIGVALRDIHPSSEEESDEEEYF